MSNHPPRKPSARKFLKNKGIKIKIPNFHNTFKRDLLFPKTEEQFRRNEDTKQTKPEMLIASILMKEHIEFKKEFEILNKYFDFLVTYRNHQILIELDGTYWHDKKGTSQEIRIIKNRCNDLIKNALAKSRGYKIIRIWDDEINTEDLLNKLDKAVFEMEHPTQQE